MNRLIIVGASGHGKVIADIAVKVGYKEIVFLDDNAAIRKCAGFPVIGKTARISELEQASTDRCWIRCSTPSTLSPTMTSPS